MNPSPLDYRKLTAADVPNIETIVVEVPAMHGPIGARGVDEPPIGPALAAMANAVQDATGVRLTVLPQTPERVAMALSERTNGNGTHYTMKPRGAGSYRWCGARLLACSG